MKIVRTACLALIATVAMGSTSVDSALAVDEVVLCKQLVAKGSLCQDGALWPKGSVIRALATKPTVESSFVTLACEDSVLEAETTAEGGGSLPITITKLVFGQLPTPELGQACASACSMHVVLPWAGSVGVSGEDNFFVALKSGKLQILGCAPAFPCSSYSLEDAEATVTHAGAHPAHPGENLALIEIEAFGKGESMFCQQPIRFVGKYVVISVKSGKVEGLGWPALDL